MGSKFFADEQLLHSIYQLPHLPASFVQDDSHRSGLAGLLQTFLLASKHSALAHLLEANEDWRVWWLPAYGCAVVASMGSKRCTKVKVDLSLVVLDEWQHQVKASAPQPEHTSLCLGCFAWRIGELPVDSMKDVDDFLEYSKAVLTNDRKDKKVKRASAVAAMHNHSPGFILAMMRACIKDYSEDELSEGSVDFTSLSGFSDVGKHTGLNPRNTCWALVWSCFGYLTNFTSDPLNKDKLAAVHVDFDVWIMRSQLRFMEEQPQGQLIHRDQINAIMTIMRHAVDLTATLLEKQQYGNPHVEASLDDIRRRLEVLCDQWHAVHNSKLTLPLLVADALPVGRNVQACLPSAVTATASAATDPAALRAVAMKNLCFKTTVPFTSTASAALAWLKSVLPVQSSLDAEHALIVIESCACHWSKDLAADVDISIAWSSSDVAVLDELADKYRDLAVSTHVLMGSATNLTVAVKSRTVLLMWTIYCLLHKILSKDIPLLQKYAVALRYQDLRHLMLTERDNGWETLQRVAVYLDAHSAGEPLFCLRDHQATFNFADAYCANDQTLQGKLQWDVLVAKQVEADYWSKVSSKKKQANRIKQDIATSEDLISDIEGKIRFATGYAAQARAEELKRERIDLSQLKQDLVNAQRAPSMVVQALPKDEMSALRALFFIAMPASLAALCRMSFAAQQSMIPRDFLPSLKVTASSNMIGEHYHRHGGKQSVSGMKMLIGTNVSLPRSYGPAHIDALVDGYNGIWYPDSLLTSSSLSMFWNGGGCAHDNASFFFNPFRDDMLEAPVRKHFTEPLFPWAWALELPAAVPPDRGNQGIARQDDANTVDDLNCSQFLHLVSLRSHPLQQFRKLCVMLQDQSAPLQSDTTLQVFLHALYQIGDLQCAGGICKLLWKHEQLQSAWLDVLAEELEAIADEIRSSPRQQQSMLLLALVASFAAQWSSRCCSVARIIAGNILAIADDVLVICEEAESVGAKPVLLPKLYTFYCFAMLCYRGGDLDGEDVRSMCCLYVKLKHLIVDDEFPQRAHLMAAADSVMAQRLPAILRATESDTTIFTDVVQSVVDFGQQSARNWKALDAWACFEAEAAGRLYHINLVTGIILCDGYPPSRLTNSITVHPLYRSTFGDRNFHVVRSAVDGAFRTTKPVCCRHYSFLESAEGKLLIKEISNDGRVLELLDSSDSRWLADFPPSFRRPALFSHWFWREHENGCILVRPRSYLEKEISLFAIASAGEPSSWICKYIPLHLRREDPRTRDATAAYLNHIDGQCDVGKILITPMKLLDVLSKFERKQLIEMRDGPDGLKIVLPRFELVFVLREDGLLHSVEYDGFHLAIAQQLKDSWFSFTGNLILQTDQGSSLKMLAPRGTLQVDSAGQVSVQSDDDFETKRKHYAFDVHERFEDLEASTIASRLYLACVHAATSTMLPERSQRQTGVDLAVALLRQCWTNKPLTKEEALEVQQILKFCALSPTLALLCFGLEQCSKELAFLYTDTAVESCGFIESEDFANRYLCQTVLNPRQQLSQLEEEMAFGVVPKREDSAAMWRGLTKVGFTHPAPGGTAREFDNTLRGFVSTRFEGQCEPFPLKMELRSLNGVGAAMIDDLEKSWQAFQRLPKDILQKTPEELLLILNSMKEEVSTARSELEKSLLSVFNNHTGQKSHWQMEVYRLRKLSDQVPQVTARDLLSLALDAMKYSVFNPFIVADALCRLGDCLVNWLELCVMEDKLGRLSKHCSDSNHRAIVQELRCSRDWHSRENVDWLVFEVECRMQIRPEQYLITKALIDNLENNPNGAQGLITLLRIGGGKTRVILPMLAMHLTRRPAECVLRLHFLSQLMGEAFAHLHRYLCASALNIKIFTMPFNRDVKLSDRNIKSMIAQLRYCQATRAVVCVTPEHRLSLYLKTLELSTIAKQTDDTAVKTNLLRRIGLLEELTRSAQCIDVFDESDEILRHKVEIIYAVGDTLPLPGGTSRWNALFALLRILKEPTPELQAMLSNPRICIQASGTASSSQAFPAIRFLSGDDLQKCLPTILHLLATEVVDNPPTEFKGLRAFAKHRLSLIKFLVAKEDYMDPVLNCFAAQHPNEWINLLALRGMLAWGVLMHCLQRRHRVDYGTKVGGKKHLAVPYRAADTPSERSEFIQSDIALLYTTLSYYYDGLNSEQVLQCFRRLLSLGPSAQEDEYNTWLALSKPSMPVEILRDMDSVKKIDLTNAKLVGVLCKFYCDNMAVINFWLGQIIFPQETWQYPQRLTANPWHLCNNSHRNPVGFSGTDDNQLLLPLQVKQETVNDNALIATNGKMLHLLCKNNRYHVLPEEPGRKMWQNVLDFAVKSKADALIDAGGLVAGISNVAAAKYIVSLLQQRGHQHRAVVYFDTGATDEWRVRDAIGRCWSLSNSPIREANAFVFFDDRHCRGADMKLKPAARAMLTVGSKMAKDKLMQAAGRMRQLDGDQSIFLVGGRDVTLQIYKANELPIGSSPVISSLHVVQWALRNTVEDVAPQGLLDWAKQGAFFLQSKSSSPSDVQLEVTALEDLYHHPVQKKDLSAVTDELLLAQGDDSAVMLAGIRQRVLTMGKGCTVISGILEGECERELEQEQERERERQLERHAAMVPVKESDWDYSAALSPAAGNDIMVLDLSEAIPLAALASELSVEGISSIQWSEMVFCTKNFMRTVSYPPDTAHRDRDAPLLDGYLRPVNGLLLSPVSKTILLLSEREADNILRLQWQRGELLESGNGTPLLLNLAYLRLAHTNPTLFRKRFPSLHLAVPARALVSIQLFSGETKYSTEQQRAELVDMLAGNAHAHTAAMKLPGLRGLHFMLLRSDLEAAALDAKARIIASAL